MRRLALPTLALVLSAVMAGSIQAAAFPDRLELPDGFSPEGIATGRGHSFYAGSLAGAGIVRGDYRTGDTEPLVTEGGPFVGMKVDARNRLWVAGGPAGTGHVFDADTGAKLATFEFTERMRRASSTTSSSRATPRGSPTRSAASSTASTSATARSATMPRSPR